MISSLPRGRVVGMLMWLGGCLLSGCATTPVKVSEVESQQVQQILDRWIVALGGAPALERLKGIEVRAVVELTAGGGKFEVHTWQTSENLYRSELSFPNGVSVIEAYDGKTAWRKHNVLGFGFVPPAELETTLRRESMRAALRVVADYPERRLLADTQVEGRLCHGVNLVPRNGPSEHWFFDAENGRLLRIERWSGKDRRPVETLNFSDYREVGGLMLSFVLEARNSDSTYTMRRIEVVPDPLVGNALWTAPADVMLEGPKVERILSRYTQAVGGLAPLSGIVTRVTQQEVEMPATGVKYHATLSQKLPDFILLEQDLPGFGHMVQGYDGVTGWVNSDMQGYRELKGVELRQIVANADFRTNALLAERCPLRKLMGPRVVNGNRTTALALATMQGPAGLYYFSDEDGRLVRIESQLSAGAQGALAVTFDFSDFRTVDGVVLPFMTTATNPALTSITKIVSVKHNAPLADSLFKPRREGP